MLSSDEGPGEPDLRPPPTPAEQRQPDASAQVQRALSKRHHYASMVDYRLPWALTQLKHAGHVERIAPGVWALTLDSGGVTLRTP